MSKKPVYTHTLRRFGFTSRLADTWINAHPLGARVAEFAYWYKREKDSLKNHALDRTTLQEAWADPHLRAEFDAWEARQFVEQQGAAP